MKKIFLFTLLAFTANVSHAQFEIDTLGYIGIHNPTSKPAYVNIEGNRLNLRAVRSGEMTTPDLNPAIEAQNYVTGNVWATAFRGVSYGSDGTTNCGVYGLSTQGGANKNFGVIGCVYTTSTKGAGVYGTNRWSSNPITALSKAYAGYFDGDTHIQGNITYSGSLTGNVLLTTAPSSETGFSSTQDFAERNADVTNMLDNISVRTYYFPVQKESDRKQVDVRDYAGLDTLEKAVLKSEPQEEKTEDMLGEQVLCKQHYGLDAGQLEEIFPDLVYENEDGTKSINYVEMVPILVQAIKELKAEIATLKSNGSVKTASKKTATGIADATLQTAVLGQNRPNPATATTAIDVTVPTTFERAALCIYDCNGKKLQQYDITGRGKQTIQVNSSILTDGIYLYSLIADGRVIQTRRMIIE